MIDSGWPITIFTREDVSRLLKKDLVFAQPLPKNEEYGNYNRRPLNALGLINVDNKVGTKTIKKARMVIAPEGKDSLVGRDTGWHS